jgi:hypothetical protein
VLKAESQRDRIEFVGPFAVKTEMPWAIPAGLLLVSAVVFCYAFLTYWQFGSASGLSCDLRRLTEICTTEALAAGCGLLGYSLPRGRGASIVVGFAALVAGGLVGYFAAHELYAVRCSLPAMNWIA